VASGLTDLKVLELDFDRGEYEYQMDGLEPEVQLFGDASEEKLAPNYSDWLAARERS
jgi:hypothetical protein